ncbi:hypothetical protein SIID45300_02484 [Candidatus Magnetaquicoccaceae bacterium FCR-1]|uniref:Secreted protein n=1 Tax=Candidatus Magnetaquiglobus chichijimensis TaxID=3141448 RepID=A0ABQ0CB69_9PROT
MKKSLMALAMMLGVAGGVGTASAADLSTMELKPMIVASLANTSVQGLVDEDQSTVLDKKKKKAKKAKKAKKKKGGATDYGAGAGAGQWDAPR